MSGQPFHELSPSYPEVVIEQGSGRLSVGRLTKPASAEDAVARLKSGQILKARW